MDLATTSSRAPDRAPAALSADALSFRYGRVAALDGVSLDVAQGRFVALLGRNGAGKTTLFSIVTGLYSARSGQVRVMGHDIRRNTLAALSAMGVVFQRSTLDMDLSVQQNLRYAAALQGMSPALSRRRIAAAMGRHDLRGLERRKVYALSGGQRRRVELARALLHEPRLLLLDEPTVGLDMQSRQEFLAHVRALCVTEHTGVLWATHLFDEVQENDELVILDRGKVCAHGAVNTLYSALGCNSVTALVSALVEQPA